jgi:DNA helicase II / ATP-dependent DNA helicase PcrA
MNFDDLDSTQREVVDWLLSNDGKLLVTGGPGAGKTTVALWAARTFLESSDKSGVSPPARVLFLTFSRSAVSQLLSRQAGVLSGYESRVHIQTFHALAYRLVNAFGRYVGFGTTPISVQSEARIKLLGAAPGQFRYDDLVPSALSVINESEMIRTLITGRWGLVICDEVQDTSDQQWDLLLELADRKLLLLGDPNQMIYSSFVPGVSTGQFNKVKTAADKVIELEPRSHRDPTSAIPALAEAVRRRQFEDEALRSAIENGRLKIIFDVDGDTFVPRLCEEITQALNSGSRDVGVFAHSNAAVSELAQLLNDNDIDHVLVGIPEAHAEALSAMATQVAYSAGTASADDIKLALAIFLTAASRGRDAPLLASALIGLAELPGLIEENLDNLITELEAARGSPLAAPIDIAMQSWPGLGIRAAYRPWQHAARHFQRLTNPYRELLPTDVNIASLHALIQESRVEALIDLNYSENGSVKLMNYHQTKGREADTVIHVFSSTDYFGREAEPFEEASKLLNVAVSRARKNVIVLLPENPHALVEPFGQFRELL